MGPGLTPPTSFASPALQADTEVVAAALASPFYAEPLPPVPPSCVLRFAVEELTITTCVRCCSCSFFLRP